MHFSPYYDGTFIIFITNQSGMTISTEFTEDIYTIHNMIKPGLNLLYSGRCVVTVITFLHFVQANNIFSQTRLPHNLYNRRTRIRSIDRLQIASRHLMS